MVNFRFGVDYYPEHWPEQRWETDAGLMQEMGLKVVRLAEFGWQKMEPRLGEFDFAWLDRALNVLSSHGIQAILGTPSATPPAWLVEAHPDILPVDSNGHVRGFGGRHHDCQSNPTYRAHVARIVTAMADHFGTDPRIAGWQTDNELGNSHDDLCHCSHCRAAFQKWLAVRYGTIEGLNAAWGTVFWSQTYDRFEQVPTPRLTPNTHNPSLLLDWKRFHSDLIIDFQQVQIDILRKKSPGKFITHNCMGFFDLIDYFKLADPLDFVSHDQYPTGYWETPPGQSPANLGAAVDLMVGLKGKPIWVMEQQSGPTGWQIMARTPRPGQLALWAAQSIAHGADTIVFFRWRSCTVGTEQFWHGILPHNGVPGRRYEELRNLIRDFSPIMPRFEGCVAKAEVAILYSYEQNWAIKIQPHHPDLDYVKVGKDLHHAFAEQNVPVDFVRDTADWSGYRLIMAPLLFLDLPGVSEKLHQFVRSGGHVVFTPRTGVKTESNLCQVTAPLPGPYQSLLGLEILDYDCLRYAEVSVPFGKLVGKGLLWWDVVTAQSAKGLFQAEGSEHPGEHLLFRNPFEAGSAWYLATFPDKTLLDAVASHWIDEARLTRLGQPSPGLELVRRTADNEEFLFVLNHSSEQKAFSTEKGWEAVAGSLPLPPYGFVVLARPHP